MSEMPGTRREADAPLAATFCGARAMRFNNLKVTGAGEFLRRVAQPDVR
jgi:hypothetical protein